MSLDMTIQPDCGFFHCFSYAYYDNFTLVKSVTGRAEHYNKVTDQFIFQNESGLFALAERLFQTRRDGTGADT